MSAIGAELIRGIIRVENTQLLSGDGTGTNLHGFLTTPNIGQVRRNGTSGESQAEAILRAMTVVRTTAFVEPDGIILHPTDLQAILVQKASTSGVYMAGGPLDAPTASLWGCRLVVSTDIASGTSLVGNFAEGSRLYVRQPPVVFTVPWGPLAEYNKSLFICEERLALAVTIPPNFVEVSHL